MKLLATNVKAISKALRKNELPQVELPPKREYGYNEGKWRMKNTVHVEEGGKPTEGDNWQGLPYELCEYVEKKNSYYFCAKGYSPPSYFKPNGKPNKLWQDNFCVLCHFSPCVYRHKQDSIRKRAKTVIKKSKNPRQLDMQKINYSLRGFCCLFYNRYFGTEYHSSLKKVPECILFNVNCLLPYDAAYDPDSVSETEEEE